MVRCVMEVCMDGDAVKEMMLKLENLADQKIEKDFFGESEDGEMFQ